MKKIIFLLLFLALFFYFLSPYIFNHEEKNKIEAIYQEDNFYITQNVYTEEGVYFEIYIDSEIEPLLLINQTEYTLIYTKDNLYNIYLDFSNLSNGKYEIYIKTDNYYYLTNSLDELDRLNREKLNDKLLTFNYSENKVAFILKDFKYEYDILIDVGHGGSDVGASNSTITEANLNLLVSLYEKERFEEHGIKVLLTRYDDTYGERFENDDWSLIQERAYTIGYYGTVSKIVYSNHTNSSYSSNDRGFELIVPNSMNINDNPVKKIFDRVIDIYPSYLINNKFTLYSRDAVSYERYDKTGGEIYSYRDYYAVIRIPKDIFNVNVVMYESAYMSNYNNFYWYYTKENWKEISETKIKYYVESLGIKYIES